MNLPISALAAKRLTRLVVEDKITEDLRNAWFDKFPPETTKLGYLVSCKICTSVWAAFAMTALQSSKLKFINVALAASEVVILVNKAEDRYLDAPTDMMGFN